MKVIIVIGALGTLIKALVQELEDLKIRERAETIQINEFMKLTRILRRILETWE